MGFVETKSQTVLVPGRRHGHSDCRVQTSSSRAPHWNKGQCKDTIHRTTLHTVHWQFRRCSEAGLVILESCSWTQHWHNWTSNGIFCLFHLLLKYLYYNSCQWEHCEGLRHVLGASLKAVVLDALTRLPKDIGEILLSLISKAKLSVTSTGLWLQSLAAAYIWICSLLVFHVWRSHVSFVRNKPRDIIISSLNLQLLCVLFTAFNAHIPAQSSVSRIKSLLTRTVLGQRLK